MNYAECMFWLRDAINNYPISLFSADDLSEFDDGFPVYEPMRLFSDLPKYDRKMNVMSIENCMCELSKYIKAVNGTGRPRNKYKGGAK